MLCILLLANNPTVLSFVSFCSSYDALTTKLILDYSCVEYILQGSGLYASIPTTICRMKPQVTRVLVRYTQFSTDKWGHLDRIEVLDPFEVMDLLLPPLAQKSLLDDLLKSSQLTERNTFGNSVVSFINDTDGARDLNEILVGTSSVMFLWYRYTADLLLYSPGEPFPRNL